MRGTATQRGYDSKWSRYAKDFIRKHPLCQHCQDMGRITASKDVDHIVPHRLSEAIASGDQAWIAKARRIFWDRSNHCALCHPCHSRKTAARDRGFGNPSIGDGRRDGGG